MRAPPASPRSARIEPPWASTIQRAMARPRPVPPSLSRRARSARRRARPARRDAGPVVGRPRCGRRRPAARAPTLTVARRVADGVLEQVGDDLVDALGVGVGAQVVRLDGDCHLAPGRPSSAHSRPAASSRSRTPNARGASGTAPASSRERSSSWLDQAASRSVCASAVRSACGSAGSTPSARFSSSACRAVSGVRSSCETLATSSRRGAVDVRRGRPPSR